MRSAARLTATGSGHVAGSSLRLRTPGVSRAKQRLVVGEDVALVVDERDVLAVGVDDRAEVGARGPHQVADARRAWRPRSKAATPAVAAYGFTASTSAPSLASTFGITKLVEP